jgi:hypothetical protein
MISLINIKIGREKVLFSLGKVSLAAKVSTSDGIGWCAMAWLNGRRRMAIAMISNFECTKTMCFWIYLNIGFFQVFLTSVSLTESPCGTWLEIVRGNASSGFSLFGFDF